MDIMEDLPVEIVPDIPNWSENFYVCSFDPMQRLHFFSHIGRWRKDPALWRELFKISLPDGTTVFHRSIGNAFATATGPGGSHLNVEVVEPFRKLRWRFFGGAVRTTQFEACNTLPHDGPLERVEFDLIFSSDLPMWQLSGVTAEVEHVGRGHTEQIGRLSGTIRIGNDSFQIDSLGNRDHSRGPRVVDSAARHVWMQGMFENGINFLAYDMESSESGPILMSEAAVYDRGTLYPASFSVDFRLPRAAIDDVPRPFGIKIDYENGSLDVLVTEYPHTSFEQFSSPWDLYIGRRQIDEQFNHCLSVQSAHYLMNGAVRGYGHIERGIPGKIIIDP